MDNSGTHEVAERTRWLYEQLVRCERHWTHQLQDQQARIATTLSVNGIMLAFIAGGGLISYEHVNLFPRVILLAAIAFLAAGVAFGILGLNPATTPGGESDEQDDDGVDFYLSSQWLASETARRASESLVLRKLSSSISTSEFKQRTEDRRRWLRRQLAMIGIGTALLVVLAFVIAV